MRQRHEARVRGVSSVLGHLPFEEREEVHNALQALMSACTAVKE